MTETVSRLAEFLRCRDVCGINMRCRRPPWGRDRMKLRRVTLSSYRRTQQQPATAGLLGSKPRQLNHTDVDELPHQGCLGVALPEATAEFLNRECPQGPRQVERASPWPDQIALPRGYLQEFSEGCAGLRCAKQAVAGALRSASSNAVFLDVARGGPASAKGRLT